MARKDEVLTLNPYSYLPCGTGSSLSFVSSKQAIFNELVMDKLGRTISMFEWEGFGETFDPVILEIYLQTQGYAIIVKVNDGLYVVNGTLGGELNPSYRPKDAKPVNPYLDIPAVNYVIGENCVVIKANELYRGFADINSLYAGLLTEALVSLRLELVNIRIPSIMRVLDDNGKEKARTFFKAIEDGRLDAFVSDETIEDIVEGAKALDYANKGLSKLKDTMEIIQYVKAQWNIELGLNDNYNMKREAINSTEVDSNVMPLETLVDTQFASRKKGVEDIKKVFGVEGRVKLGKDWKRAVEYVTQSLENAEADNEKDDPNKIEKEVNEDDDRQE